MKTRKLVQMISVVLLTGHISVGFAQYGQAPRLQGTCTETGGECNQNPQWKQQTPELQSPQYCLDNGECVQADTTIADTTLTVEEQQSLLFMREEEKLARDVYTTLYEKWNTPIFANIAMSEQRHMDSVLWLMQQYGLEDVALEAVGQFNNEELQTLYDTLIAQAADSQLAALQVGALIEEVDIADLEAALAGTQNQAVQTVYNNLVAGSENHLRSFVQNIENLGYTYTAQKLDAAQVSQILNGDDASVGFSINPNTSLMQTTTAQFRPNVSTDKGQYGNQLQVSTDERLNIGMTMIPDAQHRGQSVDIVNVVSYTPTGSDTTQMFMRNMDNNWQTWDGNLGNLVAAQSQQQLAQQNQLTVFEGALNAQGQFQINVGYILQDGTLVFNGEPIAFTISE